MDNKAGPPPDYYQASGTDPVNQPMTGTYSLQNPYYPPPGSYYQPQVNPYPLNQQNAGYQVPYYNSNQTTVVMTQQTGNIPGAVYTVPPPNNHVALAWLTCLFCCWPLGLVSIIKSMEVNTAYGQGDLVRAQMASESARKFGYASLGCGIFMHALWIIFLIIYLVVIIPSIDFSRDYRY